MAAKLLAIAQPSMDIQVSSNFERLLFELLERDGVKTKLIMDEFAASGQFTLDVTAMARAESLFSAYRLDDSGTIAEIASTAKMVVFCWIRIVRLACRPRAALGPMAQLHLIYQLSALLAPIRQNSRRRLK